MLKFLYNIACLLHYCELSTCKSCFVPELNKNSSDLHNLVTSNLLLWDVAVEDLTVEVTMYNQCYIEVERGDDERANLRWAGNLRRLVDTWETSSHGTLSQVQERRRV